ncbi:hypothetical protein X943_002193 [Babesia divergens]|uniref:PHD-type domain-containing protein n=1 Tax=Babesia divergens TaxID=32595 RepID=A0AAD9GFL1_BABDI|nr:hypothetical protein X943_002193 [Babesia divergens]
MDDSLYGGAHILSNEISAEDTGDYLNGGSDVPDGESISSLGGDDTDNGSSLNGSLSLKSGNISWEDTAVDGVAMFDESNEGNDGSKDSRFCAECGSSSGPFIICGGCGLLYHNKCLMQCFLPVGDDSWRCPQCQWKLISAGAMPIQPPMTQGDLSDDSQSGCDAASSTVLQDDASEEANTQEKEPKSKVARSTSSSPVRESAPDQPERKRKKPVTEGSNFQTKINVGYGHQVPFTPAFFLDDSYSEHQERHEWARLVYSPYHLEKIRSRRMQEGAYDSVIKDEFELAEFIQLCAQSWKSNPGWHPFSPEFAYKILHFADYDPKKALRVMNDPSFNFLCMTTNGSQRTVAVRFLRAPTPLQ